MRFGAGYNKTGQLKPRDERKLAELGIDQGAFMDQYGGGKRKDLRQGFQLEKAKSKNIPYGEEATDFTSNLPGVSTGPLNQFLGNVQGAATGAQNRAAAGFNTARNFQQQGIDPRFTQAGQQFLDAGAQQRLADANQLFGEGGAAREQLSKELANSIADIDALGVSGTSQNDVITGLLGNFQRAKADAIRQSNELSRQEAVNERNRLSDVSGVFAGQELQSAGGQAALAADLLGTGVSGADALLARQLQNRGQEAEIQQGQKAFDINVAQQFLDNLRFNQNAKRNQQYNNYLQELLGAF